MKLAMEKLERIESIYKQLPQLDCGSCGSRANLAEYCKGFAKETDCIFKLRERVKKLATEMAELEGGAKLISSDMGKINEISI